MSDYCDDRWKKHNERLDKIKIGEGLSFLEEPYLRKFLSWPIGRLASKVFFEIDRLKKEFNSNEFEVLEVGAGIGYFCKTLSERKLVKNYTILDSKSMSRLSKAFLDHFKIPCNFISVEEYESLFDKKFDLFVSRLCISECPQDYREKLLENVLPNCKRLFMVDGCKQEYNDWLLETLNKHYSKVVVEKIPYKKIHQHNQSFYIGYNE